MSVKPRLLVTMGDVAGIGPEIIAKAWPQLTRLSRPVVIGDPHCLRRAVRLVASLADVREAASPDEIAPSPQVIPCLRGSSESLSKVKAGRVSAAAGKAAFDFFCAAIDLTRADAADGIVTAPLNKEGLRAAGLPYPGHTEILAERLKIPDFGMMLYARSPSLRHGLGVIHLTLHMALRDVFRHLSMLDILVRIRFLDEILMKLLRLRPRLSVAGLNPHASDGGLFGDEERAIIEPAVQAARRERIDVTGPWPSDTLFVRARRGEFHGIVAMYHDQGHIPMKLLAGMDAVNISVGVPLIRTSVAHGTAYDIAGKGVADPRSLLAATRVAAQLVRTKQEARRRYGIPH